MSTVDVSLAGELMAVRQEGRPRLPSAVSGAAVTAAVVVIAAVAFTTQQQPSPAIAEFAPRSVEQIDETPTELAQSTGRGSGGTTTTTTNVATTPSGSGVPTTTTAANPEIVVPRVKRCVGDPPRQTEDPQSPPCIPYFDPNGDNGGATYQGVTRDSIRVTAWSFSEERRQYLDLLAAYFNDRFQFYNRRLVLEHHTPPAFGDPAGEPSFAATVDEEDQSFAGLDLLNGTTYYRELARRGLIGIAFNEQGTVFTEAELARFDPYLWEYDLAGDRYFANMGEWVCEQLVGQRAEHAGPALAGSERVFGIHLYQAQRQALSTKPLEEQLARCGVTPARVSVNSSGVQLSRDQAQTEIVEMQRKGVTTVICLCGWLVEEQALQDAATSAGFLPEWITTNHRNWWVAHNIRSPHSEHRLGLSPLPMHLPLHLEPGYRAAREVNPTYENSNQSEAWVGHLQAYRVPVLLASGIQMAGPRLTPETFAAGLHNATFPNPPDPRTPGRVGFNDGDHSMIDDAAQVYFDRGTPGHYSEESGGSSCYLERGARYALGRWGDASGRFYTPPCFNGAP